VANTGPAIMPQQIDRLFEPFQRLGTDRTRHTNDHHGIGLSIVRAIADAHEATLTARPQTRGGLQIEIIFPSKRECATPAERRPPHATLSTPG
jgi:signal transduction histidine kinase